MAKKQLKGLTSSTTSLTRTVESVLAEDEVAFQSPPFENEGQASGAKSAAESLLNSIVAGTEVPKSSGGSGGLGGSGDARRGTNIGRANCRCSC